jgi:hypothetical protein
MGNLGICAAALAIGLGGCEMAATPTGGGGGSTMTAPDSADPTSCAAAMTLGPGQGSSAPVSLTAASIGWCLHLAGTPGAAYDLWATTANETADASSFQIVLDDPTGANLETGWDVSVGESPTLTHASLEDTELPMPADVILRVRAPGGAAATTFGVQLVVPYE